ncbi:MAG: deacylase [Sulfurimonas sp.]|nr:deacylase [Sulfurimonas sp.]
MNRGMLKLYRLLKLHSLILLFVLPLALSAQNGFKFNLIQKGKQDNNTLLVVGGIQGDEPGGFISASILATHYEITKGSVWIVPNLNFYSIIKRSRGPYGDMNRKFAELSTADPEYEAVTRIKNYIKDDSVKLIVNLHDGSGFYRKKHEDSMHSPNRWGQCSIVDQSNINVPVYGNLKEISSEVVKHVNENLIKDEDIYHVHNTRTIEGDKEMEKSLTYFAINQGKAAFGNEASKNLPTHKRVYYHLLALEKYMDIMGIEYKRKFTLNAEGVYKAINNDIYISLYDEKIKLPLSEIRNLVNYFPIKKNGAVDFKASNPLLTIIKNNNNYVIQYGNRRLSKLKADYQDIEAQHQSVKLLIDGKLQNVKFGTLVDVENNFLVEENSAYRVNVIGYTNKKQKETGIEIEKKEIPNRFSLDKQGTIYRVEYYTKDKFAGMVLIKFKT